MYKYFFMLTVIIFMLHNRSQNKCIYHNLKSPIVGNLSCFQYAATINIML